MGPDTLPRFARTPRAPLALLAALAAALLAACGEGRAVVGGDAGTDVAMDATRPPNTCRADGDCAGNPAAPVCDVAAGRCVGCNPSPDTCPSTHYCDATARICLPGCRGDESCAASPGDASTSGARRCDLPSRRCVDCLGDADCPAGTRCAGNVCAPGCTSERGCPAGTACCAGACVDTRTNVAHCGACGTRCAATPPAAAACVGGACVVECAPPLADCDRSASNGCETDTRGDVAHCGACGRACAARPRATAACAEGRCAYACDPGFADCDGDAANGCETDTRADTANCGACGRACDLPRATAACAGGRCAVATCEAGFGDCDGSAANGCEARFSTDVLHCGGCGRACPVRANAVPACAGGACASVCAAGFAECNGVAADGCEVDVTSSAEHCGGCGRACAGPNATAMCAAGRCSPLACATGFADCDRARETGCEVDLRRDPRNCGACGVAARPEACNGTDDDCDGMTDEDLGQTACGMGACRRTVNNCEMGRPQTCVPGTPAPAETCNGTDDDCDGMTDEGLGQTTCGVGACRRTVNNCEMGRPQTCVPGPAAPSEVCNNMADDDCDGMVDEGCCPTPGQTCACPIVVTASSTFSGNTCGGTDDGSDTNCGDLNSPDHVYMVRLTVRRTINIAVTGFPVGGDEGDILYRGTSCPGMPIACTQHNAQTMTRTLDPGDHYFLIEDDHANCQAYGVTFTFM